MSIKTGIITQKGGRLRWAVIEIGVTIRALGNDRRLTGVGLESREGRSRAGLLNIVRRGSGGEGRGLGDGRKRSGDDVGAVDEVVRVVANNGELGHSGLEVRHHELLVVNHALPLASSALITGKSEVGLETHLVRLRERGVDLSTVGVVDAEGDTDTLEQDLEEDLGVESEWGGVEGNRLVSGTSVSERATVWDARR